MNKIYVLDTSVLVHDPYAYKSFINQEVIIPITVLEELDKLKSLPNEAGKNARVAIKNIDKISATGNLQKGIKEDKVLVKVLIGSSDKKNLSLYGDTRILDLAIEIKKKRKNVVLVSKDINLRVRAKANNIEAQDYDKEAKSSDHYSGLSIIDDAEMARDLIDNEPVRNIGLNQNHFVLIKSSKDKSIVGRVKRDNIVKLGDNSPWGLKSRNKEQACAMDLLMDRSVSLVTLDGVAGSGKTLLAVAAALEQVIEKKTYSKIILMKSVHPVGKDLGFLPGTFLEKIEPYITNLKDALNFCLSKNNNNKKDATTNSYLDLLLAKKIIEIDAVTYIRGRNIPNAFIIVDEAQSLSKEEIKTILTRAADGTKIVLTGDIQQIDNPSLDAVNNGLSYAIEKFKEFEFSGHVTFMKSERSILAATAAEIL